MGWLRRTATKVRKGSRYAVQTRSVDDAVTAHLSQFAATRRGVEAFVEPKTAVTETTLLLVAFDGEWTRRVVPSPEWAHAFAEHLKLPATTPPSSVIRSGCGTTTAGTRSIRTFAEPILEVSVEPTHPMWGRVRTPKCDASMIGTT